MEPPNPQVNATVPLHPAPSQTPPTTNDLTAALAAVKSSPGDAGAHFALSRCYISLGRPEEGETQLKIATKLNPQFAQAYHALQRYYQLAGYLDLEIETLLHLQKLEPKQAKTEVRLGQIYLNLSWMEASKTALTHALLLSPNDKDANLAMAKWDWQNRNSTAAMDRLRKSHQLFPENSEFTAALAQYLLPSGYAQESETILREGLRSLPGDRLLMRTLIFNLVRQGGLTRCQEAVDLSNQFLKTYGPAVEIYCWQGRAYDQLHQDAEAVAAYKRALEIDRSFENSSYLLGRQYLRSGRTEEGTKLIAFYSEISGHLQAYARAEEQIRLHDRNPETHRAVAQLNLKAHFYPEAIVEYKRVLELKPDASFARAGLAQALTAVGRREEAKALISQHEITEGSR